MAMNKSNITRPMVVMIVALVAAFAINVGSASAAGSTEPQAVAAANGACGGGSSLKQMISGWKKHNVDDDVARSAGQTPGLDGSSSSIIKGGIVLVFVVKGGWVNNYTCTGGKFKKVGRKYIPAGSRYYVPEKLAPTPCKKKRVKRGYEARCGNKQVGSLLVKRPCKKTPKKPKPPKKTGKVVCENTGVMVDSIQQCVTQTQTTEQDCQAGTIKQGNQCVVIQNQCGNVNVGGDNNTQGGNCNNVNICSNVNSPGGTVNCNTTPPPTCPDGRPIPPSGDCDRPPLITVIKPAHMFPNGTTYAYAKAYDPDGDEMVVNITATGPAIASVDSTVEAPSYYDGLTDTWTTCPVNWKCFRARLRASGVEGAVATVTGTVNAGGKTATDSIQTFPILPEQGFSN